MSSRNRSTSQGARQLPRWTAENSEGYPAPAALAADPVVLTVRDEELQVLVTDDVAVGGLALPGGFVGPSESAEQTVGRTLTRKTGLDEIYLEQLACFTEPGRDPRGWIPSVAFMALVPPTTEPDDPHARWLGVNPEPELAYDHGAILRLALDRIEGKLWWSNVAVGILRDPFTMTQARQVYAAIAGCPYDDASTFSRDLRATGLVRATGRKVRQPTGPPAALFEFVDRRPAWGEGRRKRVAAP